ncbi:hypothetical protein [Flavivirga rizhaonensis]|uniref:Uncharacterized protein n=1 Tax=Flavivirga rizhaonensis TaxID=2559571 RepID=A0A4S1E160_9FLAO|nr:hypothetical protein [Flavivirga rizhaonensis]TGV04326.1 hypothetical protein EM932_02060 [Flavivirga rizhaonensis]
MKTKSNKPKYVAWLSTETMHNASKKWLSELEFAKDEQLFFDDLVKSYTLQLIDSKHFNESKSIVTQLSKLQKETDKLIETIKKHERELKIMVDGIDQIELENAYKDEHGKLIITIADFLDIYRKLKTQLFALVKGILKDKKQKRLLQ